MYATNGRAGNGRKDGYSNHLGPSVRTLPSSSSATQPPPQPGATPGGGAFGPSMGPPKSAESLNQNTYFVLKTVERQLHQPNLRVKSQIR